MMKHIFKVLVLIAILGFSFGCEVDDICTEKVLTPRLKIKFHDAQEESSPLSVNNLTVLAIDKPNLYTNVTLDSILLPLDPYDVLTTYILSKEDITDTLKINYTVKSIFVSRSCGYKYNYEINTTPELTQHWTDHIETTDLPFTIENENTTTVKIYH